MSDAAAAMRPETHGGYWPSRRLVAWSAIALNFSIWGGAAFGATRLFGAG